MGCLITRQPICNYLTSKFIKRWLLFSFQVFSNEIQNILAVHAENPAGAGAIAVLPKGSNASHHIAVAQEVGSPRVAEAGATG